MAMGKGGAAFVGFPERPSGFVCLVVGDLPFQRHHGRSHLLCPLGTVGTQVCTQYGGCQYFWVLQGVEIFSCALKLK